LIIVFFNINLASLSETIEGCIALKSYLVFLRAAIALGALSSLNTLIDSH